MSKDFSKSKELPRVNFVEWAMKNESQDEWSIRGHFGYTGYRPLDVAWSTAVFSNFRSPFWGIWSLSSNSCNSRSDNMVIGGAGSFLVVILLVEYYFIQKNKENVAWPIKAYHSDERKQLLTQRLFKVVLFFLLICFITTPFPKGIFCCCLEIGTHQSPCIDFTWGHYGHTVFGLLVLAFGTAVCSTFRAYFDSIWSLSTTVIIAEVTNWSSARSAPSWFGCNAPFVTASETNAITSCLWCNRQSLRERNFDSR